MDNLIFYAQGAEPPKEALKSFRSDTGFSGTDINAMWRIKKITELFGPVGIGWYTESKFSEIRDLYGEHEDRVFCDLSLFTKNPETGEWSKPITGTGGNKMWSWRWKDQNHTERVYLPNDDCFKMAETDAFGQACKKLGIGASVYWENDRSKYTIDEDGTVSVHVPTDEEVRRENRENKAAMAESFMPKKTEAPKIPENQPAAKERLSRMEMQKRLCLVRDTMDCQPFKDICAKHPEGSSVGKWTDEEIAACYDELVRQGVDI